MNFNLQKYYNVNILAALVTCGILLILPICYSLSIIRFNPDVVFLIFILGIVILFLPVNLIFKTRNKTFTLAIPGYLPAYIPKLLKPTALILMLLGFLFALMFSTNLSSSGHVQLPESLTVALASAWIIVALLGIVLLPLYDTKAKKWRY